MQRTYRTTQLSIPQGTTWMFAWPVTANGEPVDLTGWSARGQVRARMDSAEVLHQWSSTTGTIQLTGSRVTLVVTPSISQAWTWREGVYDVELIDPDGRVIRVGEGRAYVRPEVTR